MMTPKAVLFDCDGVLVDSEPIANRIVAQNLSERGLEVGEEDAMSYWTGGTMKGLGEQAKAMGATLEDGWLDAIYEDIYAALAQGTAMIAGVDQLMDKLDAQGIPYAVGSNGSLRKMKITLGQTGLLDRLEGRLVSAHEEGTAKPDPELYLIAAKRLETPPEDCVVIDDSPTGCIAARRAGMRCIGFAELTPAALLTAEGAEVAETMAEVETLLGL